MEIRTEVPGSADMPCDKSFSTDYMLLKPEEVHLTDVLALLFSSNLEKRRSIDCPELSHECFEKRCFIFFSIVAQKALMFVSGPLAWFGSCLEMWLNLVSWNKNMGNLFLNFLKGKVVWPDRTSANFRSFLALVDDRVQLDENIKHGDIRYNGALSMMACKVSYENSAYIETTVRDQWKMEFLGSFDYWNEFQEKATTQAFLMRDRTDGSDTIIVAFRGTETFDADAWCTDFDISWYELPGMGEVHGGFMKALGLKKSKGWPKEDDKVNQNPLPLAYYEIRETLRDLVKTSDKTKIIVTGHSLGGALAVLFPAILALHKEDNLLERFEGIYTFGQPRVGNEEFGNFMKEKLAKYKIPYYRVVYGSDMVPRLPKDDSIFRFKHFGTCLFFNSSYKGKIVMDEPNKNYFSILGYIPKVFRACRELKRSFVIPYTKGPTYKEGATLRVPLRSLSSSPLEKARGIRRGTNLCNEVLGHLIDGPLAYDLQFDGVGISDGQNKILRALARIRRSFS